MALHESAEMYLETIYSLSQQQSSVRSIDVAESKQFLFCPLWYSPLYILISVCQTDGRVFLR